MLKKGLQIVIIPPRTQRVIQFRLPRGFLLGSALFVLALAVVGGFATWQALQLHAEVQAYEQMQSEYLRQQVAIRKVSNKVEDFKDQMGRLRELDYKLRLITDLETERPRPSMYGIGGISEGREEQLASTADLGEMDVLSLLNEDLKRLEDLALYQEQSFNNLKAHLADQKDVIQRSPYRWPVRGFLSSTFGPRTDPFTGQQRFHAGIDIVAPRGTDIRAPADGIVTFSGVDSDLGNMLVMDHGYGVITRYGHNGDLLVQEGEQVQRGQPVAKIGCSGRCTGPHVHYEIRINDVAINPLKMIID